MNTREATAIVNRLYRDLERACESSSERDRLLYEAHKAAGDGARRHRRGAWVQPSISKASAETEARYFVLKWLTEGHRVRGREVGPRGWLGAVQVRDDARLCFALRELLKQDKVYPFGKDPLKGIEYIEHFA